MSEICDKCLDCHWCFTTIDRAIEVVEKGGIE